MAEFDFDFCSGSRVAEIIAPDEPVVKDYNGWDYNPKPPLPYRRKFKVTLEGLRWYTLESGAIDYVTNPDYNAGALEQFYELHRKYKPFNFVHERLGNIELRFDAPVSVPKAIPDSNGLIAAFEVQMIHHNPSY